MHSLKIRSVTFCTSSIYLPHPINLIFSYTNSNTPMSSTNGYKRNKTNACVQWYVSFKISTLNSYSPFQLPYFQMQYSGSNRIKKGARIRIDTIGYSVKQTCAKSSSIVQNPPFPASPSSFERLICRQRTPQHVGSTPRGNPEKCKST